MNIERFSNNNGEGSEYNTIKTFRVYSNSLKMANVDEFPWSLIFARRPHPSLERERLLGRHVFTFSKQRGTTKFILSKRSLLQ